MPKERALACAVRLLDLGFFRIGGEEYAEANESFGVATIRREHVHVRNGEMVFDFPAKSGQRRVQSIRDAVARRAIESMRRRRDRPKDLLAYREDGAWRDVRVAEALGNTPAVCRRSYVAPRVLDRFRDGATIHPHASSNGRLSQRARQRIEREVLALVSAV